MKMKRLWWSARMLLMRSGAKRTRYARKHHIYAGIGEHVWIQPIVVPLYSELIRFHNNITIARGVDFCTHDFIHAVLNRSGQSDVKLKERIGCIEIMDNVFVGSNSVVLYGTKIGPNVVIASGSVVVKDCEPDSVYAGCPARKIGSFTDFVAKRRNGELSGKITTTVHNGALTEEDVKNAWAAFETAHNSVL